MEIVSHRNWLVTKCADRIIFAIYLLRIRCSMYRSLFAGNRRLATPVYASCSYILFCVDRFRRVNRLHGKRSSKQPTQKKIKKKEKIINSISVDNLRNDFNRRLISSFNKHNVDDGETLVRAMRETDCEKEKERKRGKKGMYVSVCARVCSYVYERQRDNEIKVYRDIIDTIITRRFTLHAFNTILESLASLI